MKTLDSLKSPKGLITILAIILIGLKLDGKIDCTYSAIIIPWAIAQLFYWILYMIAYIADRYL